MTWIIYGNRNLLIPRWQIICSSAWTFTIVGHPYLHLYAASGRYVTSPILICILSPHTSLTTSTHSAALHWWCYSCAHWWALSLNEWQTSPDTRSQHDAFDVTYKIYYYINICVCMSMCLCINVCSYECVYVCMYACLYVHVNVLGNKYKHQYCENMNVCSYFCHHVHIYTESESWRKWCFIL